MLLCILFQVRKAPQEHLLICKIRITTEHTEKILAQTSMSLSNTSSSTQLSRKPDHETINSPSLSHIHFSALLAA